MKLADFFTSSRIVLAPLFFVLFFLPAWVGFDARLSVYILVPLFIFMEFTDFLDGYFARKHNTVSDFGKLFDPFADVLTNLTILFCFVMAGYLPALLFVVLIYREMGITFVRMLAIRGGVVIAARKGGKFKTVLYIVSAGCSLAIESALRLGWVKPDGIALFRYINIGLYILAVVVSLVSFIDYLVHFSGSLKKQQ
jgi:CDP-diacylglycerol--glycerol-3-phosphate 3-phosphatidyltransferase